MSLNILPTKNTPAIEFNDSTNILSIKGNSLPEDTYAFYKPVYDYIDNLMVWKQPAVTFDLHLDYFNTSSSKCILDIFKKLGQMNAAYGCMVKINWYYEEYNDDMLETAQAYEALIGIPFNIISVPD